MLIILLALLLASGATGKGYYWIVMPNTITPGQPLPLAFTFNNAVTNVLVQVDIFDDENHLITTTKKTFTGGAPDILTIQVPNGVNYNHQYRLLVRGLSGVCFIDYAILNFNSAATPDGFELFVQTDKAIYMPGQTVRFRAFGMFSNMTVYTGKMNISIYDAKDNEIRQWLNVSNSDHGIVENSMLVDSEPILGNWKIEVDVDSHVKKYSKYFTIEKYVLPLYEVTVELPRYVLTSDMDVDVTVKAKYTYGKPVVGTVTIRADIDYYYAPWRYLGQAVMLETTLAINGEAKFTVPLDRIHDEIDPNTFKSLASKLASFNLIIDAKVTDSLNNLSRNGSASVQFYDQPYDITFSTESQSYFKPGLPYEAYLHVQEADGRPVISSEKSVEVRAYVKFYDKTEQKYKVQIMATEHHAPPSTGVLTIRVNPPIYSQSLHFEARFKGFSTSFDANQPNFELGSGSIEITMNSSAAVVGQNVIFQVHSTQNIVNVFYMVIANDLVVHSGKVNGNWQRSALISFRVTEKMQPYAHLIVYYFKNSAEWNADSTYFDINDESSVFKNKVSLAFDKTTAEPGDMINLQITTDPRSFVYILAVDQSVLLMKTGNDITQTGIIKALKPASKPAESYDNWHNRVRVLQANGIQVLTDMPGFSSLDSSDKAVVDCSILASGQPIRISPTHSATSAPYHGVGSIGQHLIMIPNKIDYNYMLAVPDIGMYATTSAFVEPQLQKVQHTRAYFPETWLWSDIMSNDLGQASIATIVPDTITSWVASAFSVNTMTGLGVASAPAMLRTFRPFFVNLNLAYSVVRGEQLVLQANVFNYMTQDVDVVVTLEKSEGFKIILPLDASGHMQYLSQTITKNVKVAAGKAESVFIPIVPVAIGKIDVSVKAQSVLAADGIKRQLLVEPEGIHREYNYPFIIAAGAYISVPIILPSNLVEDSLKIRVTAMGDVMVPTLKNLDQLLEMPHGCGEQTMITLAPDVFVTNYLQATHQLTDEIRQKALSYMQTGYQHELTFQHFDGSFSIWGERDAVGSMWLTAFIVKSFHQAKKHIYVSEVVLTNAIRWMLSYQKFDGSFEAIGSVHDSILKGGTSVGYSLTAFCLIALLENDDIQDIDMNNRIQMAAVRSRVYLENHVNEAHSIYDLAIMSYALALSGSGKASLLSSRLDNMAIVKDDKKFWSTRQLPTSVRDPKTTPWSEYYEQSSPIDIEIAAYVLLYYVETRNYASVLPVLKWLVTQRNANGGFQSTQDTVLGLQAMSEYGRLISDELDLHLNVATYNFTHSLTVQTIDRLVLKTTELPVAFKQPTSSGVNITATGKGAALIQVHVSFNELGEGNNNAYNVSVDVVRETLHSIVTKICVRWTRTGSSGMTVMEIGILSGFKVDFDSPRTNIPNIKKQESKERNVVLYFDKIDGYTSCIYLEMIRLELVARSQPATIKVYDYYEPGNSAIIMYESNLLKDASICDICVECAGCGSIPGKRGQKQ